MKNIMTVLLLTSSVSAAAAQTTNLVTEPLTSRDGEIALGAAFIGGKEWDDNDSLTGIINARYGITDNWTIGLDGLRYRFVKRPENGLGLELTAGLGFGGYYESDRYGDAEGGGLDISGKYVFSRDFALLFAAQYVDWDEENREDKEEFNYSLGAQKALFNNLTFSTVHTYRDLTDFAQEDANEFSLGLDYQYSKQTNMGAFLGYSDFDPIENGYNGDASYEQYAGVYVRYRF
jgi:hypothetical protein